MAIVRGYIRRWQGRVDLAYEATPDYELDFLAINLCRHKTFREFAFEGRTDGFPAISREQTYQWRIATASSQDHKPFWVQSRPDSDLFTRLDQDIDSDQLLRVRARLSALYPRNTKISAAASALARSIELFMATFSSHLETCPSEPGQSSFIPWRLQVTTSFVKGGCKSAHIETEILRALYSEPKNKNDNERRTLGTILEAIYRCGYPRLLRIPWKGVYLLNCVENPGKASYL
jgi:AraC-like DNA-binding protein